MAKKKPVQFEDLPLIGDEPVRALLDDRLSLRTFADTVAAVSLGTEGPFTIGVFGKWGHGKTSLLRLAKSVVDEQHRNNVTTAWFNAWQYEKEPHPIVPLVATIIRALEEDLARRPAGKIKKGAAALIRALRAVAYGFSAKSTIKIPGIAEVEAGFVAKEMIDREEQLKGQSVDPLLDQSLYYNAFQLLDKALGQKEDPDEEAEPEERPKIVVFVDDLDRCFPKNAVHLLESIKLVLAQPGFVFVLAVDQQVIHAYLDKRYREEFGLRQYPHGQSYLDKIIQLPFAIPSHEDRFETFIGRMLERRELAEHAGVFAQLKGIIGRACNFNPREVVRFFNGILLDRFIWDRVNQDEDFDAGAFTVARSLKNQCDHIYRLMLRDDGFCKALTEGKGDVRERLFALRIAATTGRGQASLAKAVDTSEAAEVGGVDGAAERRELIRSWTSEHDTAVEDLLNRKHLRKLLDSEPGQQWLKSAELRRNIEQFIAVQRAEKEAPSVDEADGVPEAIRGAIKRGDAAQRTVDISSDEYWCDIPFGTFLMGAQSEDRKKQKYDESARDRESPVHEVQLDGYRIARNPVTVGEYRRFVDDDGYIAGKHWNAGGFGRFEQPGQWKEQLAYPNRPVTSVSWYEAAAFAAWAGVRLSTEAEWERAARGKEGRRYPWGNEQPDTSRANFEMMIGHATPIGVYPRGATPEGVFDMAGNVWEWCGDWYGAYKADEQVNPTGSESGKARVVRGGAWHSGAIYLRPAYRNYLVPGERVDFVGFRVASGT